MLFFFYSAFTSSLLDLNTEIVTASLNKSQTQETSGTYIMYAGLTIERGLWVSYKNVDGYSFLIMNSFYRAP
jgi:hypothetical protein